MSQNSGQPPATTSPHQHDTESRLAMVLTLGTSVALALALLGIAMFLFKGQKDAIDLHTFGKGVGNGFRGVRAVFKDSMTGDPMGVMQLAALVLIATPVTRVAFALVAFAIKKDRLYTLVALVVLAGLAIGFTGLVE